MGYFLSSVPTVLFNRETTTTMRTECEQGTLCAVSVQCRERWGICRAFPDARKSHVVSFMVDSIIGLVGKRFSHIQFRLFEVSLEIARTI